MFGIVLSLLSATASFAQQPERSQGLSWEDTGVILSLDIAHLRLKVGHWKDRAVQKDLGVSEEQNQRLNALFTDLIAEARGIPRDLSRERVEKKLELQQKEDDALRKILDPKQYDRLSQIILQQEAGVFALGSRQVVEKLALTAEQRDKMAARVDEYQRESRLIREGPDLKGLPRVKTLEELEKLAEALRQAKERTVSERLQMERKAKEKVDADLLAILTDEQRETWALIVGKKFERPALQGLRQPPDQPPKRLSPEEALRDSVLGLSPKLKLCGSRAVQIELAISDEQRQRLDSLVFDLAAEAGTVGKLSHVAHLADEALARRILQDESAKRHELMKKEAEALQTILDPKQYERLNQIELQDGGPSALGSRKVAEKLALRFEDLDRIRARCRELSDELTSIQLRAISGQETYPKTRQLVREASERAISEILEMLTAQQRETWQQMIGPKFEPTSP